MGILIGPTPWWQSLVVSTAPVGSTLHDGSIIICRAGGTAWIVAPANTQVVQTWNNSTSTQVGDKCCVCDWPTLNACMISRGFNPGDWFVPSISQLQNPGSVCSTRWNPPIGGYWSSTEINATRASYQPFGSGGVGDVKSNNGCVRAFRCVTY